MIIISYSFMSLIWIEIVEIDVKSRFSFEGSRLFILYL